MNIKKILIIFMILICFSLSVSAETYYQTKPGVYPAEFNNEYFVRDARFMEKTGAGFGLQAEFAEDKLETSDPNNVDIHMIKNTEWGAIAMLSASQYGAGNGKVTNKVSNHIYDVTASTTGNMTGVFGLYGGQYAKRERVAALVTNGSTYWGDTQYVSNLRAAAIKHVDQYLSKQYIPGDAMKETSTFSGGSDVVGNYNYLTFVRGEYGVFHASVNKGYDSPTGSNSRINSRIAVWCGQGL